MASMPNCAHMDMDIGSAFHSTAHKTANFFFKDCARIHMAGVDCAVLKAPVVPTGPVLFTALTIQALNRVLSTMPVNAIRGPPPDRVADFTEHSPSILLTTRRFRQ
jgi:hypothetical protein